MGSDDERQVSGTARVRFLGLGLEVQVPLGARILDAARAAGAPEGSRCAGVCACSTCHVHVRAGREVLTPPTDEEIDVVELACEAPDRDSRLGCQARIMAEGTVEVEISEESFRAWLEAATPDERERGVRLWARRSSSR